MVGASLLAMQVYVKRAVSGRLRQAADSTGEQYDHRATTGTFISRAVNDTTTISLSLNEPDLQRSVFCQHPNQISAFCQRVAANPSRAPLEVALEPITGVPSASPEAACACSDIDGKNGCSDPRVFATVQVNCVNEDANTRSGEETVGTLTGTDLWD